MPRPAGVAARGLAALAAVALLLAAPAAAETGEVRLPEGMVRPLAVLVAPAGTLWFTLDGTWAVGAYHPATQEFRALPLAEGPAERDSLWDLRLGPDGALWTASRERLHRVDPATGEARAWPLPEGSELAGGLAFVEGRVLVAGVTSDRVHVLDPVDGSARSVATPDGFGPLLLAPGLDGTWVSGTYGGTLGRLDLEAGVTALFPDGTFEAPVGFAVLGPRVLVAEHGASTVALADPATGSVLRYPVSPSPFYPIAGPVELHEDEDGVWMVHHFADRVSLLDLEAGTLVEWMTPSAPGANMQKLARAPDGRVWWTGWSKDVLGWLRPEDAQAPPDLASAAVRIEAGGQATLALPSAPASVATSEGGPAARADGTTLALDAAGVAPGSYRVLVSWGERGLLAGRYVAVEVVPQETAAPGAVAALAALGAALLLSGRRGR